ncbi:MAG TPA: potassium channel family protein [Planctomycetota bacterium]|nr:potassium channel family protein [Planctomycetota bacterium]
MLKSLIDRYRRRRFAWLLFFLLVTIGAHSAFDGLGFRFHPLQALLALNLLAAIGTIPGRRGTRAFLVLGGAFVALQGLRAAFGGEAMFHLSEGAWVSASLLATAATARQALRRGPVDGERIAAALDAYLLGGLVFGVCFWVLGHAWPGSFRGVPDSGLDLGAAIYFSFVTIATLGYGDVVPASEAARGLAILEAVGGQMYLAVLVARLVSLYAAPAAKEARPGD